ncbi:uncharacterized protein PHALS_07367 [Plasmopara halstedii]|uniref:FYVE-type domain-containing protein n=1 Tax=Plasmopara halstedii TaxID=4781 RepID=A0A0N7L8E0_PLAHL|nr:uncharacterized protein PHALS_07367 [Plasmopara halstedii]CEG49611.1 hypothetical protein PHALS_07367 [Plasmopara halstedii]|eukprot:XP_024585980.1 hypothetical protein PHALS_07367 [Plasmopara halstedii]
METLPVEMAIDTSPILHFPISPGCYHPTRLKCQEYTAIVRERVNTMLQHEHHITNRQDQHLPPIDTQEWKQVQSSKDLCFYKQIRNDRTIEQLASEEALPDIRQAVRNGYSTMLCRGQIQGSMENIMYGMTTSSQADLMTAFSFKNAPRDCVWLGTIENSTSEDPFHSVDFIWTMPKVTAYVVDTCYLKATGVESDINGKQYGYLILHSVDLPQCRPFDARGVSRIKMYISCLFREISSGILNVTVRGILNPGKRTGIIAKTLIALSIKSFMVGLLNSVSIGLAKKLTLMARRNHMKLQRLKQSECSICMKTQKRLLFALKTHLFQCGVCGATACADCIANTKQILLLGRNAPHLKQSCCTTCLRDARVTYGIRPKEPEFQVVADYYLHQNSHIVNPISPSLSVTSQSSVSKMYPLDTITRSQRRSLLKSCLSADMPTNSTADSLNTNSFSRDLDEADFCFSDDESPNHPESSLNLSSDSNESTLTFWHGTHRMYADDFIPMTAKSAPCSKFQLMQTLFQLNIKAENTLLQTQATTRGLRGAELD